MTNEENATERKHTMFLPVNFQKDIISCYDVIFAKYHLMIICLPNWEMYT